MVLIDFLNKTIPGGGKNFFFALRAKSCPPLAKILCMRLKLQYSTIGGKKGGKCSCDPPPSSYGHVTLLF